SLLATEVITSGKLSSQRKFSRLIHEKERASWDAHILMSATIAYKDQGGSTSEEASEIHALQSDSTVAFCQPYVRARRQALQMAKSSAVSGLEVE
ncbi:hypothetical protein Tco_0416147, partial [Tanacetum coccineum]